MPIGDVMLEGLKLCLFAVGLVLLSFGAWLAWEPAGFMLGGLALTLTPIAWVRGRWASSSK